MTADEVMGWTWGRWELHKQFIDEVWLPAMVRGGANVLG